MNGKMIPVEVLDAVLPVMDKQQELIRTLQTQLGSLVATIDEKLDVEATERVRWWLGEVTLTVDLVDRLIRQAREARDQCGR